MQLPLGTWESCGSESPQCHHLPSLSAVTSWSGPLWSAPLGRVSPELSRMEAVPALSWDVTLHRVMGCWFLSSGCVTMEGIGMGTGSGLSTGTAAVPPCPPTVSPSLTPCRGGRRFDGTRIPTRCPRQIENQLNRLLLITQPRSTPCHPQAHSGDGTGAWNSGGW